MIVTGAPDTTRETEGSSMTSCGDNGEREYVDLDKCDELACRTQSVTESTGCAVGQARQLAV